jgi:hypothetical protein
MQFKNEALPQIIFIDDRRSKKGEGLGGEEMIRRLDD